MKDITIDNYINNLLNIPIIDVRSPAEFEKGHVIGAVNIPLFSNEERAKVGTVYKQQSKEKAIELGYKYVNPKLDWFVSESKKVAKNNQVVVYCWRGGMRSQSFAGLLQENGLDTYRITDGYKAFRNYVLNTFEQSFNLKILGGYTGSGKTKILQELQRKGEQVIDLEGIAKHRGSAFGSFQHIPQPTTEQFENELFWDIKDIDRKKTLWLEDESMNIGRVNIPKALFSQMREAEVIFLSISKEERAKNLIGEYANNNDDSLRIAINNISKRLGGLTTKETLTLLDEKNYYQVAINCLTYYDKYYLKGLQKRDEKTVKIIETETIEYSKNAELIIKSTK